MNLSTNQPKSMRSDWVIWSMMLLALGGIMVSAYLLWAYTAPGATLACGSSHGCDTVKNSEYARLLGVPLPLIGLLTFLAIFVLIILRQRFTTIRTDQLPYLTLALFGITLTGVLYSAYLTYLELFVIVAICRWCVMSAIIMVTIFLLALVDLRQINQPDHAH